MKTALILHGMPSKKHYLDSEREAQSNSHWLPWIQQQLLTHGILAQALELPEPYEPVYENWKTVFERFDVDEETILIGHSCGAGFLVRWLSENKTKTGKVALVAPWLDPNHELGTGFFDFTIDADVPARAEAVRIFISNDDDAEMQTSVTTLESAWAGADVLRLEDKGHFTLRDMGTKEFPELKEFLLG